MSVWIQANTPTGDVHLFRAGDVSDDQAAGLAQRAKVLLGFPADVIPGPGGWVVCITRGEPHPTLVERAIMHDVVELAAVDDADLSAFLAAEARFVADLRVEQARAVLAGLDPDVRATLLGS